MPDDLVQEYLYRLKSPVKKAYAEEYAAWLAHLRQGAEPPRPVTLTPPAALVIRNALRHLVR